MITNHRSAARLPRRAHPFLVESMLVYPTGKRSKARAIRPEQQTMSAFFTRAELNLEDKSLDLQDLRKLEER